MMDGMKKMMTVVAISVCIILLACGNKEKQTVVIEGLPTARESESDTVAISVQIESSKEEEIYLGENSSTLVSNLHI